MNNAYIVSFMTNSQCMQFLIQIKSGKTDHLAEWILEGLQDRGLIDHKNKLTDAGNALFK